MKRYWTLDEIAVNLPPSDCKFVLATDYDSLLSVLRQCVSCIDHLTHGVRDKDAETNILAAARKILEGK